jgi:hypothetical protein
LNDEQPPRLVIYVPLDQSQTDHALVELEAAGVVMQPGQQPPQRNTRLALVARNALKPILGDDPATEVEKQVEAGKLTLANLNALAEKGKDLSSGVVSLVFGTSNPQDVALAFLTSDKQDGEVEKKSAKAELLKLIDPAFDVALAEAASLPQSRERLSRHVLLTDLIAALGSAVPASLASVSIAHAAHTVDNCRTVARVWRLRRDVRDSYVAAASKVEQELGLAQEQFDPPTLQQTETFLALERALQRHVEGSLLAVPTDELLALAQSRLARFWSDAVPPIQARWALVADAARVLLEADRVAQALKKAPATVPTLVREFAEGESPWCLLDTYHRHMESRWYNFEPELGEQQDGLDKLILKAEQRYTEVGSDHAKHFVQKLHKGKGRAAAGGGIRVAGQTTGRRRKDRVSVGGCPAVRDGAGTVRCIAGRFRDHAPACHRRHPHHHRNWHGCPAAASQSIGQGRCFGQWQGRPGHRRHGAEGSQGPRGLPETTRGRHRVRRQAG